MGANVSFDVVNRHIDIIKAPVDGVVTIDFRIDVYSDGKEDWETNANDERAHRFPIATSESAGRDLGGGVEEPVFFSIRNGPEGWRIHPYDADHELHITGTIVREDPMLPIFVPVPGRTVAIFFDGSQVAGLSDQSVRDAMLLPPSIGKIINPNSVDENVNLARDWSRQAGSQV